MKKSLQFLSICTLILFCPIDEMQAQNSRLNFDISYPVQIGDTFYSNYDVKLGIDLIYEHPISTVFHLIGQIGYSSSNFSFTAPSSTGFFESNTSANIFRILTGTSLTIRLTDQIDLVPNAGLGYAHIRFNNDDFDDQNSQNGLNTTIGLSFDFQIWNRVGLGVFSSYHFIYLEEPENAQNISFNREMHSINSGIKLVYIL